MSQPSGYQYPLYVESNSTLKNNLSPMVNGQSSTPQQNGMQSPHYNLTGTPSSQSSRDPSRETSRDPSPTQYLQNQYRPQLSRPPMPPITASQSSNVLPPPPRTSQPFSPINPYGAHGQYATSSHQNVGTSSTAFVPQPNQETHHRPMIPSNQMPPLARNLAPESETSTPADIKSELAKVSQSYQWATSSPPTNIPQGTIGVPCVPSSIEKTSQVSTDQTTSSQALFPRANQPPMYDQNHPISSVPSNISLPSPNVTQYSSQDNNMQQDSQTSSVQPPRTRNVQAQLPTSENSISPQLSYGSQQSIFSASSTPQMSSNTQSLFPSSSQQVHNMAVRNSQDYYPQSLKSQPQSQSQPQLQPQSHTQSQSHPHPHPHLHPHLQSQLQLQPQPHSQSQSHPQPQPHPPLQTQPQQHLTGQVDPMELGGVSQGLNVYQNLAGQRKYPQQDTANTAMTPPRGTMPSSGINQLHARPPSSRLLPGHQYDTRLHYPGPMTNVPLDSLNRRYPNVYPDQLNQLNNQMSNLNVTQGGFDQLWGAITVDLLQGRNILPPKKVEPPKIKLQQELLDTANCSPEIFRCTLTKVPDTNMLLQKSRLPFGVLIHPFKDLNQHLPVIQCNTIVRCRACRTYINPFVIFIDMKRWKCNLCFRLNEFPEEFHYDPVTKSYGEPTRRPEAKNGTIEFIAPSEYMLRPPQPAVYLFVVDVSRLAIESGYLQIVCNTITDELSRLPGDSRTQIGFLAVDSALHFFSMPDNVSQPHEMIMLDIDDVFLPCPENLIVNLKEREELIRDLLAQLPVKFHGTHDTSCALGAALQAAYKLLFATGGRVTVFQTCLPNCGPGTLQSREDPNARSGKDVPHLNPATDFYKRFALDCSGQQIAIDLFLLNSQYSDLATLSCMSKFTGGCIFHVPLFRVSKLQSAETLERMLRRYLTRKIGFEAVMRIRCTRGLSIQAFHGSFFVRSTDLLTLPNINPDAGFGMQIAIEENLSDLQSVCFQAALLYTSSKGERRIRVHTLCLPVVKNLSDILHAADQQCIVGLLSKMAVDRSLQSSLSDARDALINVAIDVLSAYKMLQSSGTGRLLAPESLKLLPLYIIALLKSVAFRSGTSTRLDDRVFAMFQLKTLPLAQLMQMVYPDLYPVHALDDRNAKDIEGKICPQPPRLHLSAERLDARGVFLLDAGDKIYIYVGKNVNPVFCSAVFGVSAFTSISEELYELPKLNTVENERLRHFIFSLQEEKPFWVPIQIIREDSHFRTLFVERLIEDRFETALSYYEFLQHLKLQVKE
ncbi:protein transport protein Sec24A isoform X3 [Odontomachus brunneus]|uniref:protein transport protein Sec24A isoform X3 n=1 Tax=Odontomachus brunneus TaxID=486640 RepID=UPI0013F1FCF9|nr:protein transport protein Sec24A isoform X3 [Odontomachus brunneus]